jgi:hypothetical protein
MREDLRNLTLGDIEEYFRSLNFGALKGNQWVQVISIIRTALQGTRAELPPSLYWRRVAISAAVHVLSELEKDIQSWTKNGP